PLLVWAGRMDRVKRLDFLVDVLDRVSDRMRFFAVFAGEGPERKRIESLVAARAWAGDARFTGWVRDISGWLMAGDLVIFPSLTEGMPNVVLEAMAAGRCVVASDIPACRELIRPGRTGVLVDVDNAQAFADAVVGCLVDSEGVARMGAQAVEFIKGRFSVGAVVRQLSGFYADVVGRARGGQATS